MAGCCAREAAGDRQYDLAVIGAGSAGFSAAITAADRGARVLLVGYGTIGGTCVNVGCVPSKTLIRAAEAVHQGIAAHRFAGIEGGIRLVDWSALRRQKDELVTHLRKAKYEDLLTAYPAIRYLPGKARLTADGVEVDGTLHRARRVIITTGSRTRVPDIPGLSEVPWMDSTAALDQERLPSSMLVIGAGYIGVELAQAFSRLGVETSILCRRRLLPDSEPEISEALSGYFETEGIRIHSGVRYRRVERTEAGVRLLFERAGEEHALEGERLLVTAGRKPATEGLGLEELGVEILPDGAVRVDRRMRTSRPGIYAAGDVTGRHMFVYMAAHGGKIAALNALEGDRHEYDDRAVPSVVFSDPQVASVGLTESMAEAAGHSVRCSTLPLDQVPRAIAARDVRGLIKLVAERESGRLLGAHILAPEGADSVQTAVLALRGGLTVEQLGTMIFPYLTTVEGLKLAAQTFDRDVARLSCCAG